MKYTCSVRPCKEACVRRAGADRPAPAYLQEDGSGGRQALSATALFLHGV